MSRALERNLRRVVLALSALAMAGACALLIDILLVKPGPKPESAATPRAVKHPEAIQTTDPKVAQLGSVRMSKTIVRRVETPLKPQAPELSTLIRIKGILDFGDSKNNEALIENLRSGQTKNYRAGESLQEIEAVIEKIEAAVTFKYDGKSVTLGIKSTDSADAGPVAAPAEREGIATGVKSRP